MATENDTTQGESAQDDLFRMFTRCEDMVDGIKALARYMYGDLVDSSATDSTEEQIDRLQRVAPTSLALIDLCRLLEQKLAEVESLALNLDRQSAATLEHSTDD